jgi:predicted transcriptional regulator of viral defense system
MPQQKGIPESFTYAIRIFQEHGGLLRSAEAQRQGINPAVLKRMTERNILEKEERGLYRLSDTLPEGNLDFIYVSMLVPKGVVCLTSALSFHELTTQIPREIYIALPQSIKAPNLEYPPLAVVWMSKRHYEAGREIYKIGDFDVRVYNAAKTIADCFKFRSKIGEDIALEGLKEYIRRRKGSIADLMDYAAIDGVKGVIKPYLKVLQ